MVFASVTFQSLLNFIFWSDNISHYVLRKQFNNNNSCLKTLAAQKMRRTPPPQHKSETILFLFYREAQNGTILFPLKITNIFYTTHAHMAITIPESWSQPFLHNGFANIENRSILINTFTAITHKDRKFKKNQAIKNQLALKGKMNPLKHYFQAKLLPSLPDSAGSTKHNASTYHLSQSEGEKLITPQHTTVGWVC